MRSRFTPWPVYVDLLGALAVFVAGALYLAAADSNILRAENERLNAQLKIVTEGREKARQVYERLLSDLPRAKQCSDEDICIDIAMNFDVDDDRLSSADEAKLAVIATEVRQAVDALPSIPNANVGRDMIQIVVEGHTDRTEPYNVVDPRELFKYNWDLSARRASSVLYFLKARGISVDTGYNVVAWGLGSSVPIDASCDACNRRTTVRLKFDYAKFAVARKEAAGGTSGPLSSLQVSR